MGDHPNAISLEKYGIDLLKTIPYGSKRYILQTTVGCQDIEFIFLRKCGILDFLADVPESSGSPFSKHDPYISPSLRSMSSPLIESAMGFNTGLKM